MQCSPSSVFNTTFLTDYFLEIEDPRRTDRGNLRHSPFGHTALGAGIDAVQVFRMGRDVTFWQAARAMVQDVRGVRQRYPLRGHPAPRVRALRSGGLFVNGDSGFDSEGFRTAYAKRGVIPNVPYND